MEAYCSWCLRKVIPKEEKNSKLTRTLYKCPKCNSYLVKCRAPSCHHYARWGTFIPEKSDGIGKKETHHDQFCIEHMHEIANFDTTNIKLERPSDFRQIYDYKVPNLSAVGKISFSFATAAILSAPLFYLAAPAIGGAIGTSAKLTGAVARNYGLAKLGFGSLATGGLGMAGGMMTVTSAGSILGGTVGAYIGNSYLKDIESFEIKEIKPGKSPAIITINGFLSEKDLKNEKGYTDWEVVINKKFSDRAWYHVYWESKRLSDLGYLASRSLPSLFLTAVIGNRAKHAFKPVFNKIAPIGTGMSTIQLATNPWHIALKNAGKTGFILADILSRTNKKYTILAHSLGCRVTFGVLQEFAKSDKNLIEDVHLTGGAVDRNRDKWKAVTKSVNGKIFNYHSKHDKILGPLYKVGTFFKENAIGFKGIDRINGIRNIDVSGIVKDHKEFKPNAHRFLKGM